MRLTVAPKRGRQKLPEGKVEISPPLGARRPSWKDGRGVNNPETGKKRVCSPQSRHRSGVTGDPGSWG